MRKNNLRRWRTPLLQSVAIVLIIATLVLLTMRMLRQNALQLLEERQTAQTQAMAASQRFVEAWAEGAPALQRLVDEWSLMTGSHVTILDRAGAVVVDSSDAPLSGVNYSNTADVRQAQEGGVGVDYRALPLPDETTSAMHLFVTAAGDSREQQIGMVRTVTSTLPLFAALDRVRVRLNLLGLLAAFLIVGVFIIQTKRTARNVRRLTDAAERITAGDLSARVLSVGGSDMGQLTHAFNHMASRLESQIHKRKRETDRLTTIMHAMADGVLILSRKGKVRMINPTAAQLLDISEEKALKRSYVQTVRDHRIAAVWVRCRESGRQEVSALDLGPDRFLRVIVTPFLSDNARGYVVVIQDLTRLHKLQTVRQDFVSNVSHELRTPLASMRALVDTLRDGALDDPPAARRFLDRMEIEVDSLTQMVQELLELSRIESGKVPLRISPTPVESMVAGGVDRLRPQAERANIDLTVTLDADLPAALADGERIQQVITNLVHNAIKFTPAGGRIEVNVTRYNGHRPGQTPNGDDPVREATAMTPPLILTTIADNGVGIAANDLARIFERFYKTDPARTGGGTGLGLAIAKHIVQAHGGDIWAESVAGHGSTFYFTLPAAATTNPENSASVKSIPMAAD